MTIKEFKEKYLEQLEKLHKLEEKREFEFRKATTARKTLILPELANTKGQVFILEQIEKDLKELED